MPKRVPLRMCIACRKQTEKTSLIRVVRDPSGALAIDRTGKSDGRGAYICADPGCLDKAYKKRALERALRMPVPPDVYDELRRELQKS